MTTPNAPALHPHRRSRLALARDLVVAGLCALLLAGFLLDLAGGARLAPRADGRGAALSS